GEQTPGRRLRPVRDGEHRSARSEWSRAEEPQDGMVARDVVHPRIERHGVGQETLEPHAAEPRAPARAARAREEDRAEVSSQIGRGIVTLPPSPPSSAASRDGTGEAERADAPEKPRR